jgi:hypothetical protein
MDKWLKRSSLSAQSSVTLSTCATYILSESQHFTSSCSTGSLETQTVVKDGDIITPICL